jgi:hypothetical protein
MRSIFLYLLLLKFNNFYTQPTHKTNDGWHSKYLFPVDTSGTNNGQWVTANKFDYLRYERDTLYVDGGLYYLSKQYNFQLSIDSLSKISDTVIYYNINQSILDSATFMAIGFINELLAFEWKKNIPNPNPNNIESLVNVYKGLNSNCSTVHWKDKRNWYDVNGDPKLCSYIEICQENEFTYWCSNKAYTKIFEDDFNGVSLNKDYWKIGFPWGRSLGDGWSANAMVEVSNGTLKLRSLKSFIPFVDNDGNSTPKPNDKNAINGVISTNFSLGHGKYEIKAKIPYVKGNNPSYWLFGENLEIDGFEFFRTNGNNRPTMSIYSNINNSCPSSYSNGNTPIYRIFQTIGGPASDGGNIWNNLPDLSANFYTYTIVFDPNYITWWIEGTGNQRWCLTYFNKSTSTTPSNPNIICGCTYCTSHRNVNFPQNNNGLNLILQNAASCTRNQIGQNECFPDVNASPFEIDWVKIYQIDDCGQNKTFTSGEFNTYWGFNKHNVITGDNITLGGTGTFTVRNGLPNELDPLPNKLKRFFPLFARANNEINLANGFIAEEGSVFEATNAFRGDASINLPNPDCMTINYWPQYYRNVNTEYISDKPTVSDKWELFIYPNPTKELLKINSNKIIEKTELYDVRGVLIISSNKSNNNISTESLDPGLYLIKSYSGKEIKVNKFIKQ